MSSPTTVYQILTKIMSEVFQQQNIINIRGCELGYHVLGATLKTNLLKTTVTRKFCINLL